MRSLAKRDYSSGPGFRIERRPGNKVLYLGLRSQSINLPSDADNKAVWEVIQRHPSGGHNRRDSVLSALRTEGIIE